MTTYIEGFFDTLRAAPSEPPNKFILAQEREQVKTGIV